MILIKLIKVNLSIILNLLLNLFEKIENNDHETAAPKIQRSPIVKFKFTKLLKLPLNIINETPNKLNITPKYWKIFNLSL